MGELKAKYNQLLERYRKAEIYMNIYHLEGEELATAISEREKHIPEFRKIMDEMGEILKQIGDYTKNDIWQGFDSS